MSTVIDGSLNGDPIDTIATLDAAAGSQSRQVFIAHDQKANGTNGGVMDSQTTWQTRDLNTIITNTITGASLDTSTSRITLPAGTYLILASAPAYRPFRHVARLRNITDSADSMIGTAEYAGDTSQTRSLIDGIITISAEKVFELQHYIQRGSGSSDTDRFGRATALGVIEVYCMIRIEKIE
jgi:hypothetical protein